MTAADKLTSIKVQRTHRFSDAGDGYIDKGAPGGLGSGDGCGEDLICPGEQVLVGMELVGKLPIVVGIRSKKGSQAGVIKCTGDLAGVRSPDLGDVQAELGPIIYQLCRVIPAAL